MNKFFYLKLAAGNLKRNKETYFPYLLASGLMIVVYHTFFLIANNDGMKNIPASETLQMIMTIGVWVGAVFSVIFIFYANSFLMKRRKKEFGLYGILGLEKRHVARILVYETGMAGAVAVGGGIVTGTVFSKLSFLILMKMIHVTESSRMIIRGKSVFVTMLLFLIIFILTAVFNLFQVSLSRPVDLMSSKNKGEKEPKGSALLAAAGLVLTGAGYYTAQTVERWDMRFGRMLFAVVAVMAGTYFLFIAGSVKILRMLKKNKKIYYKPDNFVSISGLIWRLRQNAVGLGSICIICTMILITLSVTLNLQTGGTGSVKKMNGVDLKVSNIPTKAYETLLLEGIQTQSEKYHITVEECYIYPDRQFNGWLLKDGSLVSAYGAPGLSETELSEALAVEKYAGYYNVILISAEDYKRITGEEENPDDGHGILISADKNRMLDDGRDLLNGCKKIRFYGYTADSGSADQSAIDKTVEIDKRVSASVLIDEKYSQSTDVYLVLKDAAAVSELDNTWRGSDYTRMVCNFSGNAEDRRDFIHAIKAPLDATGYAASFGSFDENMESFYIGYGGLVFVGVMISVLFLLAMVLIIYYKQMSEGLEDRERYQIMIRVGIDKQDVRRTITKQVKTIFFVPLIVAVIHTAAAFKLTGSLLSSVMYPDDVLSAGCTLAAVAFVVIVYAAVYGITARVYYRRVMNGTSGI